MNPPNWKFKFVLLDHDPGHLLVRANDTLVWLALAKAELLRHVRQEMRPKLLDETVFEKLVTFSLGIVGKYAVIKLDLFALGRL